jgi:hypothetical protein
VQARRLSALDKKTIAAASSNTGDSAEAAAEENDEQSILPKTRAWKRTGT